MELNTIDNHSVPTHDLNKNETSTLKSTSSFHRMALSTRRAMLTIHDYYKTSYEFLLLKIRVYNSEQQRSKYYWSQIRLNLDYLLSMNGLRMSYHRRHAPAFIIDPEGNFKAYWDCFLALLICYTTVVVPFRVGFTEDSNGFANYFEKFVDMSFGLEIVLNFLTGVKDAFTGIVRYNRTTIALTYIQGWFILDVLSTFPFEEVMNFFSNDNTAVVNPNRSTALLSAKLIRTLKILRLVKLVRVRKIREVIAKIEDSIQINQSLVYVIKIFIFLILLCHLSACFLYWVGTRDLDHSWITMFGYRDKPLGMRYVAAFYWAMVTTATLGYGDIHPVSDYEKLATMIIMAIGVTIFGYVIGNMSFYIQNIDAGERLYQEHMTVVNEYIILRKLPPGLAADIRKHFDYDYTNKSVFDEERLLKILPTVLKNDIILNVSKNTFQGLKFFANFHQDFVASVVSDMHPFSAMQGENIFVQHSIADCIFFVVHGVVSITKVFSKGVSEIPLAAVDTGEHFGEIELFHPIYGTGIRICTATAKTSCDLYFLPFKKIMQLKNQWPGVIMFLKDLSVKNMSLMKRRSTIFKQNPIHNLPGIVEEKPSTKPVVKSVDSSNNVKSKKIVPVTNDGISELQEETKNDHVQSLGVETNSSQQSSNTPVLRDIITQKLSPLNGKNVKYLPSINTAVHELPQIDQTVIVKPEVERNELPIPTANPTVTLSPPRPLLTKQPNVILNPLASSYRFTALAKTISAFRPFRNFRRTSITKVKDTIEHLNSRGFAEMLANDGYEDDLKHSTATLGTELTRRGSTRSNVQITQEVRRLFYHHLLIHPLSYFIVRWDIILTFAILYSALTVPFVLAFDYRQGNAWTRSDLLAFFYYADFLTDCIFGLDILLKFRTAYYDNDRNLVVSTSKVALHYLKDKFTFDLISTLPFDRVMQLYGPQSNTFLRSTKLLRLLRLIRLLKLLRIIKIAKAYKKIKSVLQISPFIEKLFEIVSILLIFGHWDACLFHWVMIEEDKPGVDTWCSDYFMTLNDITLDQHHNEACTTTVSIAKRYIACLYWAFTTLTTVGYGDIRPYKYSVNEMMVTLCCIMWNSIVFAYIINRVILMIQNFNPSDREYNNQMNDMRDYLRGESMDAHVEKVVSRHCAFYLSHHPSASETQLLDRMHPPLRYMVARHVATDSLLTIPLIKTLERCYQGFVSHAIYFCKPILLMRSEVLCRAGGPGNELFFLLEGSCEQLSENPYRARVVHGGHIIEAYSLLATDEEDYRIATTCTVISRSVRLYSINREDFNNFRDSSDVIVKHFAFRLAHELSGDEFLQFTSAQQTVISKALQNGQTNIAPSLNNLRDVALFKYKQVKTVTKEGTENDTPETVRSQEAEDEDKSTTEEDEFSEG